MPRGRLHKLLRLVFKSYLIIVLFKTGHNIIKSAINWENDLVLIQRQITFGLLLVGQISS